MAIETVTKPIRCNPVQARMIIVAFLHVQAWLAALWVLVASINSAVVSALIAGCFGVLNVTLLFYLESRQRRQADELDERERRLKRRERQQQKRERQ